MDILVGILVLLIGVVLATMGLRLWFWMLPILGFMAGFFLGMILVYGVVGDGVWATILSWIAGIAIGAALAVTSVLWWYAGAIVAVASSGALLTTGLATTFGIDTDWILILLAILGAALFAIAALVFALPLYIVVVSTAIAGGIAVVSGLLLIFDQIDVDDLGSGYAVAVISDSLIWWLPWIVVTALGILVQLQQGAMVPFPRERFVPTTRAVRR